MFEDLSVDCSFSELEALLEETASNIFREERKYHDAHKWDVDDMSDYIYKELSSYSSEKLEYHLTHYKSKDRDMKLISRTILIFYRDMEMSAVEKLKLPVELLWAK